MNLKIIQFPEGSTRVVRTKEIRAAWMSSCGYTRDDGFESPWLKDHSEQSERRKKSRVNWGAISGLAFSLAVSAACWAGLVMLIQRLLR